MRFGRIWSLSEDFDKDAWIQRALDRRIYYVDDEGNVWKRVYGEEKRQVRMVKFSTHRPSGRVYFNMTFEGITKSVLVNRVVAIALMPNPHGYSDVNHIDGDKANNHPSNLEWNSRSQNEKHAFRTGLKATRGSQNSNAKLTAPEVMEIRALAKQPDLTITKLAVQFKVSPATIRSIIEGKTWSHL